MRGAPRRYCYTCGKKQTAKRAKCIKCKTIFYVLYFKDKELVLPDNWDTYPKETAQEKSSWDYLIEHPNADIRVSNNIP